MKKSGARFKLVYAVTAVLFAGFFLINILNYETSRKAVHDNIVDNILPLTGNNIYSEIQQDLIRPVFISSLMANDTFLKDWVAEGENDVSKIITYLSEIKNRYGFFSTFFVSEKTGNYYHYSGILKKIDRNNMHDIWYYRFRDLKSDYDLDVDTNEAADGAITIFINHRLKDRNGNFMGVTGVGLKLEAVSGMLEQYGKKYGKNIYLIDSDGLIQVHPDKKLVEKVKITEIKGFDKIASKFLGKSQTSESSETFHEFDMHGKHILLLERYIPEFNWHLIVEHNETGSLSGIRQSFATNLFIGFLITFFVIIMIIFTINYFQKNLEIMATVDKLTEAFNRREFERQFEIAAYTYERENRDFSLIMYDIDCFKNINDRYGHLHGDKILIDISKITMSCIRKSDVFARWGGDEFMVLTFGEKKGALFLAERIRESVTMTRFTEFPENSPEEDLKVSISCGVAHFRKNESLDSIISRTDRALYEAKEKGRNLTVVSE